MNPFDILIIVLAVGYVLLRRMAGRPVVGKSLLILPVVLTVIGASQLKGDLSATTIAFVAYGVLLSVLIGAFRGLSVKLFDRDGVLWMRYRAITVVLWVVNLAAKVAMMPFEHAIDSHAANAADKGLMLAIGLGILTESLVVMARAMRHDTPMVWAVDRDGQVQSNDTFEQVRQTVRRSGGGLNR